MAYASILVHLDDDPRCAERVSIAQRLAIEHRAHLIGLVSVAQLSVPAPARAALGEALLARAAAEHRQAAERIAGAFESAAAASELRSYEKRVVAAPAEDALRLAGRYADLVIAGKPADDASRDGASLTHDALARLVQELGRPMLVVPGAGHFESVARRPLVAWSATRESMRAVADALPLLRSAERVDLMVFNGRKGPNGHGDAPGADIGLFLARHGVKVEVHDEVTGIDVGNALLSRAADLGSDLLVMGAYGHSYVRETLFGGVTDTILHSMPLPVLMSH